MTRLNPTNEPAVREGEVLRKVVSHELYHVKRRLYCPDIDAWFYWLGDAAHENHELARQDGIAIRFNRVGETHPTGRELPEAIDS